MIQHQVFHKPAKIVYWIVWVASTLENWKLCVCFLLKLDNIDIELFFIQIQSGNKRKFKSITMDTLSTWKVHGQTLIIDCSLWRKEVGCFLLIWQFCVFQMQRWHFSSYCNIYTMYRTIQNPSIQISYPNSLHWCLFRSNSNDVKTTFMAVQWYQTVSSTCAFSQQTKGRGLGLKHRCHCCH